MPNGVSNNDQSFMPLWLRHWGVLIHLYYQVRKHIWTGKQEVMKSIGKLTSIKLNWRSVTSSSQSSLVHLQPQWKAPRTDSKEKRRFGPWFHAKYKVGFFGKVSTNLLPGNSFQCLQSCWPIPFFHLIIATHKQPKTKHPLQIPPRQSCTQ